MSRHPPTPARVRNVQRGGGDTRPWRLPGRVGGERGGVAIVGRMPTSTARTHYRTCNLCEAMCGVRIDVEGGRITSIRGDEQDPFSRGHICPKAVALKDLHEDKDRLRHPMRRTASGWE